MGAEQDRQFTDQIVDTSNQDLSHLTGQKHHEGVTKPPTKAQIHDAWVSLRHTFDSAKHYGAAPSPEIPQEQRKQYQLVGHAIQQATNRIIQRFGLARETACLNSLAERVFGIDSPYAQGLIQTSETGMVYGELPGTSWHGKGRVLAVIPVGELVESLPEEKPVSVPAEAIDLRQVVIARYARKQAGQAQGEGQTDPKLLVITRPGESPAASQAGTDPEDEQTTSKPVVYTNGTRFAREYATELHFLDTTEPLSPENPRITLERFSDCQQMSISNPYSPEYLLMVRSNKLDTFDATTIFFVHHPSKPLQHQQHQQ